MLRISKKLNPLYTSSGVSTILAHRLNYNTRPIITLASLFHASLFILKRLN